MIGFVQGGGSLRADRYTYLPQIGIWLALGTSVSGLFVGQYARKARILAASVIVVFAALTARQVTYWENSIVLFERAFETSPFRNLFALQNLAYAHSLKGNFDRAAYYYTEAIRMSPTDGNIWNNLGSTMLKWKKNAEALQYFDHAMKLRPEEAAYGLNRAMALERLDRGSEAEDQLKTTLELNPDFIAAYSHLARLAEARGDHSAAVEHLQNAIQLRPKDERLRIELERVLEEEAKEPPVQPKETATPEN